MNNVLRYAYTEAVDLQAEDITVRLTAMGATVPPRRRGAHPLVLEVDTKGLKSVLVILPVII